MVVYKVSILEHRKRTCGVAGRETAEVTLERKSTEGEQVSLWPSLWWHRK
jgi:hypothetical protein